MNNIEELIAQLCPEGVEFRELGEVMSITRGASPRPILNYLTNDPDGISWIKIGDVNSKYKYITKTKERITKEGAEKSRHLKKGDFVLSNSMSFGRPYILAIDGCIHDGWISMQNFESELISDFLYHLLRSDIVQKYWKQKASSGTVQNLNADIVKATKIPIPPLPIQQEIANILDNFMQFEAELQVELEARMRQYEYYRNDLLNFENKVVEWKTLGEIGEFVRGNGLQKKDFTETGVGCIHYGQIYTYYGTFAHKTKTFVSPEFAKKLRKAQKGDLIIATTSENVEDVCKMVAWLGDDEIAVSGDAYIYKHNQNPMYLAYYLQTPMFFDHKKKYMTGTKVIRVSGKDMAKFKIPIPPLTEQNRIVAILDQFNKLVNDISVGLPAEILARRKQYEYYRGKLLDFKSVSNG
ncbi:MAG: restriction endonuclease subunit S [Mariniphaga sp.]